MKNIIKRVIAFFKLLNEEFELSCEESYKIKKAYKQKTFKDDYVKF